MGLKYRNRVAQVQSNRQQHAPDAINLIAPSGGGQGGADKTDPPFKWHADKMVVTRQP